MIKKCNVTLKNKDVLVVSYDGTDVQFTNTGIDEDVIFVKFENDKYSIVDECEYNDSLKSVKKKYISETIENKDSVSDIVEGK